MLNKISLQHRIYYNETDQMGRVYHANFLIWMEKARTEWLRANGITYKSLEDLGIMLPVTELNIKYFNPVTYDELVKIEVEIIKISKIKVIFNYKFMNEQKETLFGEATTTNLFTDKAGKLKRVTDEIFNMIVKES